MTRAVRYSEFVQAVRRYRPTDVVAFLAAYSAERERSSTVASASQWFPWSIALIAKESILRGNEFRSLSIDRDQLRRLLSLVNSSSDILPGQSAASLLTPVMYEQAPYQESVFEEMARTHALLVECESDQEPIRWDEVLGIGLDEAIRASHVLHAWVLRNGGQYDPSILDRPDLQELYDKVAPRTEIEAAAALLTSDIPGFRRTRTMADEKAALPGRLERYAFNPLRARPFVDLGAKGIWCPQTMLISRAFLGPNLYYRGLDRWGKRFADSLGDRTQRYVGRQLAQLDGIDLRPEFEYDKGKRSIDWIWISSAAVILVECKAARLTLDAQAGGDSLPAVMQRYLGEARHQIDETARMIRAGHPAFEHIPKDRPVVGVVTTSEQFYLAGTPFSGFESSGEVPATTLSLRDLEVLVGLPEREAAAMVIDHAHPRGEGGRFGGAFDEEALKRRNPILDKAWRSFDFVDPTADTDFVDAD